VKTIHLARGLTLPAAELYEQLSACTRKIPGGCWLWKGTKANGYGRIVRKKRRIYVHRAGYAIRHARVPKQKVCHKCDTPPCWRPSHLFAGTQAQNLADMRKKGRGSAPPRFYGEAHPIAKLTRKKVAEIRELRAHGVPQRTVAKRFHVSQATVGNIVHRRTWR
jgi:hypothetical protein